MATDTITGGIRPVTLPNQFPPMPAITRILARFTRAELHGFIAVALDLADTLDGDADSEPDDQDEVQGDELDSSWIEWTTMRGAAKRVPNLLVGHEDDEDDDPAGQYDEDYYTGPRLPVKGAGCPVADPGGCEHDGREEEDGI